MSDLDQRFEEWYFKDSGIPKEYWPEFRGTFAYVRNRVGFAL